MAVEAVAQFGLPQQNNLQQLAVVGFDVREQADLFEQFLGQILRLVYDEHRFPALLDLFEQKFADERDGSQPVAALDVEAEFGRDGLHQPVRVQHRVEDERGGKQAVELFEQRAAKRRLARADFARELHEALALADAVKQMIVRLTVPPALKQKTRIRREVERRLFQTIVFQIHAGFLAEIAPAGNKKGGTGVPPVVSGVAPETGLRAGDSHLTAIRGCYPARIFRAALTSASASAGVPMVIRR